MKRYVIIWLIILVCILCSELIYETYIRIKHKNIIRTEYIIDTIYLHKIDTVYQISDSLVQRNKNLEEINSKLYEELNIATLKLERIKEYNNIASKDNNIKYLRGWINRVLNE